MEHDVSEWPFWLTLGGDTILPCTGSIWLAILYISLCSIVVSGYLVIAYEWHVLERACESKKGKALLRGLKHIFLGCGICGYGSVVVRVLIPAWSPYIASLLALCFFTWRYIFILRSSK